MAINKTQVMAAAAAVVASMTLATPASAGTGCNGVINPFVWGCAPWDNNNGSRFPYYNAPKVRIPNASAKVETINGAQFVTDLRNGKRMPLVGNDGASMVAAGGMN